MKKGVRIKANAAVECPNCVIMLELVRELRSMFDDERASRESDQAKAQEERAGILTSLVAAVEKTVRSPDVATIPVTSRAGRAVQAPRAATPTAPTSFPTDLAARIGNMRLVDRPAPLMTVEEALATPLSSNRVLGDFAPPETPPEAIVAQEEAEADVLGVAAAGAASLDVAD